MAASQTRRASFFLQAHSDDGMWRSPVAQRSGGPEVASSNLVIPTKNNHLKKQVVISFYVVSCFGLAKDNLDNTRIAPQKSADFSGTPCVPNIGACQGIVFIVGS